MVMNVINLQQVKQLVMLFTLLTEAKVVLEQSLVQIIHLPNSPILASKHQVSLLTKIITKEYFGWDLLVQKLYSLI
jgi:hypothetical protein